MAKTTMAPLGATQFLYQYQVRFFYPADDHLCNTVSVMNKLGLTAQVDQYNFYFPPVITVDGARRIETGNTLFNGQSAPWP